MRLFLNMPIGNFYGWAVCGKNLLRELAKKCDVRYIEEGFENQLRTPEDQALVNKYKICTHSFIDGVVIHTLKPDFSPTCHTWGAKNIGYLFYESDSLTDEQINNLNRYDAVLVGSAWSEKVLNKHGIQCGTLVQGIDPKIFHYMAKQSNPNFVIFSGGKWEYRKGQDLVIRAVKSLKFPNVVLRHNWVNVFDYEKSEKEIAQATECLKVERVGLEEQKDIALLMADTDIGLFLNRCEGGTNLVLMEYLACGRTAIVRSDTGQRDVVHDNYAFLVSGSDDEVVKAATDHLEYAYHNRNEMREKGKRAAEMLKAFSWGNMASNLLLVAHTVNGAE